MRASAYLSWLKDRLGGPVPASALLPTPMANEAEKATNLQTAEQRGQTGQVYLTNVAQTIIRNQPDALLPTPIVSDANTAATRDGKRGFSNPLRNALLPTPDAYAGSRGGSSDPDGRRSRGQTVTTADVVEHKLMPTPTTQIGHDPDVANQIATRNSLGLDSITGLLGMPEETWTRTDPSRLREDSEAARRRAAKENQLLPTPVAQPSGNTPEDHLRKKPGRQVVTDLAVLTENGLLETGGRFKARGPEEPPEAVAIQDALLDIEHGCGNARMIQDHLPTPRASAGMNAPLRPGATDTSRLEDAVAVNLYPTLPTPTVLDQVEKRTTHAGGGLTLQGVVGGVNPVDAARMVRRGVEVQDWKGLPTPCASTRDRTDEEVAERLVTRANRGLNLDEIPHVLQRLPTPRATDGEKGGPNQRGSSGDLMMPSAAAQMATAWGDYEPAIRRWEAILGVPAPAPTEISPKGTHRLSAKFTEWMMGQPPGWITDPAIGISRNDQLKACGNGVVTQQAVAALEDMLLAFTEQDAAA